MRAHEGPVAESPEFSLLRQQVAAALTAEAPEIAALRDDAEGKAASDLPVVVQLVRLLGMALDTDETATDDGVEIGLAFGVEAFEAGASLHHMLKGIDLLGAMTMYAMETTLGCLTAGAGTAADGVRLCRRLQEGASLLSLAAAKGYTQAVSDGMRDRFRHLRHDLRNPLGTIKSVLALMDDETVPADARAHPRFRAMAERNARSLDELIVDRLSDAAAMLPALSHQRVSLRVVACGVRRDLRGEAELRDATISVGEARARVSVDAVSLELLLHAALLAALQESSVGDELVIDFGEATADRATVLLTRLPTRPVLGDPAARERLAMLAGRVNARATMDGPLTLSIPVRREVEPSPPSQPSPGVASPT
jgi:signal transduction histidine kinase